MKSRGHIPWFKFWALIKFFSILWTLVFRIGATIVALHFVIKFW